MGMACSFSYQTRECQPVQIGPSRLFLVWCIAIPITTPAQLSSTLRPCAPSTELSAWHVLRGPLFLQSRLVGFPHESKNQTVQLRLWLQGDNCPKEVRNSFTGKWACLLAQANYFVGAAHHHMVVGHTHEDIGGICRSWKIHIAWYTIYIYDIYNMIV